MFGKKAESGIDKALRLHSEGVREARTQQANDQRLAQGLAPKHCGAEASMNRDGDWACVRCGDVFA